MSNSLAATLADKILRACDRLVACLDGLSVEEAAWRPPAADANSVAAIVNHMLANLEENVFSVIGSSSSMRDRATEFAAASPDELRTRWSALRPRAAAVLSTVDDQGLLRECEHPRRGRITVGEMLVVIRGHIGEHEGQAALTRDLVVARRA